ncbi:MAG TPA: hypothetical protein RMH99_03290 [Sandaracinaceae bacterium LLY-WYZ-13_1]|nr:hypothetical protein [Sandaracinaceae bacterium LLY-WYZ-13_1]
MIRAPGVFAFLRRTGARLEDALAAVPVYVLERPSATFGAEALVGRRLVHFERDGTPSEVEARGWSDWAPAASVEGLARDPARGPRALASDEPAAPSAEPTGERSESSVLFPLSNLQALSGRRAAREARAPGEGSGLIDIRALVSVAAASTRHARPGRPTHQGRSTASTICGPRRRGRGRR